MALWLPAWAASANASSAVSYSFGFAVALLGQSNMSMVALKLAAMWALKVAAIWSRLCHM